MADTKEKLEWNTETRTVNELVSFENNPRELTEFQKKKLRESIEKFNLVEIPAIDTEDTVLAGNQRLKILKLLERGDEEIDVRVPNRPLTDEERREYNIRSNKNNGEFNFDILEDHFDFGNLKDWGFKDIELGVMDTEADTLDLDDAESKKKEQEFQLDAEGEEESHVKMVQLFLTEETEPQLREWCEELEDEFGTDNLTDTVFECVKQCAQSK